MQEANPPPEVLRAAQREFKRLQRGSEQHPGAQTWPKHTLLFLSASRVQSAASCPLVQSGYGQPASLLACLPACLLTNVQLCMCALGQPCTSLLPRAGYSMSLAYLETLADLPWSRLSSQPALPHHLAAATAASPDDEAEELEGDTTGSGRAQQVRQTAAPAAPTPLPLAAVRQRLDDAHYGLDKIKERIVQYVAVQRLR